MSEKRKPIKRKGKQPHKKLNMKEKHTKRAKPVVAKSDKTIKSNVKIGQIVNQFKANGLTLLKGQGNKNIKISLFIYDMVKKNQMVYYIFSESVHG